MNHHSVDFGAMQLFFALESPPVPKSELVASFDLYSLTVVMRVVKLNVALSLETFPSWQYSSRRHSQMECWAIYVITNKTTYHNYQSQVS
jgi:hypothetical protein